LRGQTGVHDPAVRAGQRVEADAHRLVARHRLGAHQLQVGGQAGRGAVEAAQVHRVAQAGGGQADDDGRKGHDDGHLDQRHAAQAGGSGHRCLREEAMHEL